MRIEVDHVTVGFQGRHVLEDLSVTLTESRIGVIGDNGSGKSTFARLLNGLLLPDHGSVTVDGINTKTNGKEVRRKVGFLFQNPDNQIVMPTVAEDLVLGLKPLSLTEHEKEERIANALEHFGLSGLAERSAHLLSGGEKQLLALAGVMVAEPSIIVCDEPTTLLDRRNTAKVMEFIAALTCPVITVTHHLEHLEHYDRVLVFSDGRVICDDTPENAISAYMETLP